MQIALLLVAAFLAGALNAIAGGGSFLTFPALVFSGLPAVAANATSTVALFPGSFASAFSYRHNLASLENISLRACILVSIAGGIAGAILLLKTPEKMFVAITPWLLLFATVLFAFGREVSTAVRKHVRFGFAQLLLTQFVVAVYGGYFGGSIGILMLALFGLFGLTNLHAMNGLKAVLAGCLNAVAVVIFVAAGKIYWREALLMAMAAVAGGYCGASFAQRISTRALKVFVIAVGLAMSVYFFVR